MSIQQSLPKQLLRELSMDDVHEVLASQERRALLVALRRDDVPRELEMLSLSLEGRSERTSEVDRCCARLYHNHVPKLQSYGLVRYDRDCDVVELTDRGALLSKLVDR